MTEQPLRRAESYGILSGCAAVSLLALAWSWRNHAMLNYGDAVAHLHIARRVIDAHEPGLSQLGSVWLPLPHLLMIPFVAVYAWWASGFAAVIPNALAWLASCYGIYRLARRWLRPAPATFALAFFATNPNLLYMQTTAMTEPLFLCEMVWTAVWLVEWRAVSDAAGNERRSNGLLYRIALVLTAAVFTRYDGWVMAFLAWVAIGLVLLRRKQLGNRAFWIASIFIVAGPVIWMTYNAVVFGDWLAFLRGPYSAKAIELRTATPGSGPPHPGWHNPWVSLLFFMKTSEMDAAAAAWGNWLLALSLLGVAWAGITARGKAFKWSLLLWLPAPFYAYSVAYGSVPIFLPVWWPHSYYNTRYGLELLPALAIGVAFAGDFFLAMAGVIKPHWRWAAVDILLALAAWNAVKLLHEGPLVYIESTKNIESRRAYEVAIPPVMRSLLASDPGATVLMNTSVFPQIVAFTGIPLRQTINESDRMYYQAALDAPAQRAALVLAFAGDSVDRAVHAHPEDLLAVAHFTMPGQPAGTLYVSDTSPLKGSTSTPKR